jgi:hypothetical protein
MPFATPTPTRRIGFQLAWLVIAGFICVAFSVAAAGAVGREAGAGQASANRMTIHIAIGSKSMMASLEDNPTARDFVSLLPLTVTLREFGHAEKVSGALTRPLSEEGAPTTDAGAVGDIAYYAPWQNLAFYRGPGPNATGVIKIAKITSGIEALQQTGEVRVTISRAK